MSTCVGRKVTGVLRGSGFELSFSGGSSSRGNATGITAELRLQFQRQYSRVYDVVSSDMYFVEAPATGDLTISRVVGSNGLPRFVCSTESECCEPFDIKISARDATCWPPKSPATESKFGCLEFENSLTAAQALPQGIAIQTQAETLIMMSTLSFVFADLKA